MSNARRTNRGGFTLIELLTVMAILALLASILLPSIFAAQQAAWTTKCNNNLHNLGIILQHFATPRGGFYPSRDVSNPCEVSATWKNWFKHEGINPEVLFCPNACRGKVAKVVETEWAKDNPVSSYEILVGSTKLGSASGWLKVDQIPSKEMMAADLMCNTGSGENDGWVGNHTDRLRGGKAGMVRGRNVLFADYHVDWVSFDRSKTRTYMSGGGNTYYLPDVVQ